MSQYLWLNIWLCERTIFKFYVYDLNSLKIHFNKFDKGFKRISISKILIDQKLSQL